MAAQATSNKRKSVLEPTKVTKKVKTVEASAPLKSALKKAKDAKVNTATKSSKEKKVTKTNDEAKDESKLGEPKKNKAPKTSPKTDAAVSAVSAKPAKKATTPKKETKKPKSIIDDTEDAGADLTSDQTSALLAGFSDSEDEDEASADPDHDAIPLAKIPSAPTAGLIKKRIKMAIDSQSNPETTPGVVFIGRLPHGFYEHQLRAYLSQFGDILHLRLARNKRSGRSQHYAFVEFASAAVSDIVAKTMDKYLLFEHILQVRRVRREDVKENMFAGEARKKPVPRNKLERGHLRRGMVRETWEGRVEKETLKRKEKEAKLKELGYEFAMPTVKAVSDVAVRPKAITENGEEEAVAQQESGDVVVDDALGGVEAATVVVQTEPEPKIAISMVVEPHSVTVVEEKIVTKKRAAKEGKTKAKKVKTV